MDKTQMHYVVLRNNKSKRKFEIKLKQKRLPNCDRKKITLMTIEELYDLRDFVVLLNEQLPKFIEFGFEKLLHEFITKKFQGDREVSK